MNTSITDTVLAISAHLSKCAKFLDSFRAKYNTQHNCSPNKRKVG